MKIKKQPVREINSISELHRLAGMSAPKHPLITLINHADEPSTSVTNAQYLSLNFYHIAIKRSFR